MNFTYSAYCKMISLMHDMGYPIVNYKKGSAMDRCAILRHDVDNSLDKAVEMAEIEAKLGVSSTFFVLLATDFYNVASKHGREAIRRILDLGHDIGLHFDETLYPCVDSKTLAQEAKREADILSQLCGCPIETVSMHRPSARMLDGNFQVPGLINVYGKAFFKDYKYVSDSRRNWREPVLEVISSGEHQRLHILTHPFWYGEQERDIYHTVRCFVNQANKERYVSFKENITNLEDIMKESEVR